MSKTLLPIKAFSNNAPLNWLHPLHFGQAITQIVQCLTEFLLVCGGDSEMSLARAQAERLRLFMLR
jgi:hypothetical protein